MDAPMYPPAIAFEQPLAQPYAITLQNFSLAELMKMPAAWAIVLKHMPSLKMMTGSPMISPYLGNLTVQSLSAFGKQITPEVIATINDELSHLPSVQEPVL